MTYISLGLGLSDDSLKAVHTEGLLKGSYTLDVVSVTLGLHTNEATSTKRAILSASQ